MVVSGVFFLDIKGRVILGRNYRGDLPADAADHFGQLLAESCAPVVHDALSRLNYIHVRHTNLILLAIARQNTNAMAALVFLHRLARVFAEYFGELEEESVRDNFVLVYELLDEMMDYGHAQTTETKVLQEYITQTSFKLEAKRPPSAVTSAVSWRTEGIKYRKNEVFLDVLERVNCVVAASGNVLHFEVLGSVQIRCFLSGMPELRLGLNDKVLLVNANKSTKAAVEIDDVKFHQCVKLSKFESDRIIAFIPPDGAFELMSYRLSSLVCRPQTRLIA